MSFVEIPRYNIQCDGIHCPNVFAMVEFDLDGEPIDHYVFETMSDELTKPLIDVLLESEWTVIDRHIYCPECSTAVTNRVLMVHKMVMGL